MKSLLISLLLGISALAIGPVCAQSLSAYTVNYMVTYDAVSQRYTAWVVPQYSTPNSNNPEADEYGVTAQLSLKIPRDFVLSDVQDKVGSWEKQPRKIGSEAMFTQSGADPMFSYYIIGKTPTETKYGEFKEGVPIALFTFKGKGGDPEQVQALMYQDPFVGLANRKFSLNVRSSFYSRSGQLAVAAARPLEQFQSTTTIGNVMKKLQAIMSLGGQFSSLPAEDNVPFVVYPNPTQDEVHLKVFSLRSANPVTIELVDGKGVRQRAEKHTATEGVNTLSMRVADLPGGTYLIKTQVDDKVLIKTLVKY